MQSDWKQIYKLTAERTGVSEQIYKDLGNFVFAALYKTLRRPPSLIIKLKGIGYWYMRRQRMQIVLDYYPIDENKEVSNPLELFKYENKKEIQEIFKERLKEYEQYIKERDEVRRLRNATEIPVRPDNWKHESD